MAFDDDFFNDPFEDLVRNFFSNSRVNGSSNLSKRNGDSLPENIIETKNNFYFVLDLSNLKEVSVKIKENILEIKGRERETIEYSLPKILTKKKFDWRFNNGILEVNFKK